MPQRQARCARIDGVETGCGTASIGTVMDAHGWQSCVYCTAQSSRNNCIRVLTHRVAIPRHYALARRCQRPGKGDLLALIVLYKPANEYVRSSGTN